MRLRRLTLTSSKGLLDPPLTSRSDRQSGSDRQSKRDDLVRGSMVRPEMFPIERERATSEGDNSDIIDFGCFLPWIEARDRPALAILLRSPQDVDQIIDKGMSGDLRPNVDLADHISIGVELQDSVLVPLT